MTCFASTAPWWWSLSLTAASVWCVLCLGRCEGLPAQLQRDREHDPRAPHSPENCLWHRLRTHAPAQTQLHSQVNSFSNQITIVPCESLNTFNVSMSHCMLYPEIFQTPVNIEFKCVRSVFNFKAKQKDNHTYMVELLSYSNRAYLKKRPSDVLWFVRKNLSMDISVRASGCFLEQYPGAAWVLLKTPASVILLQAMTPDVTAPLSPKMWYIFKAFFLMFSRCLPFFWFSDLALRNCLLTANVSVKIGDYGLSHTKYKVHRRSIFT